MGRLILHGKPKSPLDTIKRGDPLHKTTPAKVDSTYCAGCNKQCILTYGKVHAVPDNSDLSVFGTKRLCNACYLVEAEDRKQQAKMEKVGLGKKK